MSEFPPAGVHRQKLDVATRDLENAAEAISAALGIDAAKVALLRPWVAESVL